MGKVTRYRRSWRWNRKKYFNYVARNYLKYSCNVNAKVMWLDQDNNNIFWPNNNAYWTMADALAQAGNELISLRGYFASLKITGVAVKVTPGYPANPTNANSGTTGVAYLAIQQMGEEVSFPNASHSPRSMCLSQFVPQRKYFSLTSSWAGSNSIPMQSLNFVVASDGRPMRDSMFNVQMTFYILFKTAL